jgi:hypothetical protein
MIYDEGLMDNFRFHAVPECSLPNRLSVRSIIRGTGNRSIDTGCAETAADIDQPAKVCSFPVGRAVHVSYVTIASQTLSGTCTDTKISAMTITLNENNQYSPTC